MLSFTNCDGNLEIAIRLRKTHRCTLVYSNKEHNLALDRIISTLNNLYGTIQKGTGSILCSECFSPLILLPLEGGAKVSSSTERFLDPAQFFIPESASFIAKHSSGSSETCEIGYGDDRTVVDRVQRRARRTFPWEKPSHYSETEKLMRTLWAEGLKSRVDTRTGTSIRLLAHSGWTQLVTQVNIIFTSSHADMPHSGSDQAWSSAVALVCPTAPHVKLSIFSEHAKFPDGLLKEEALAIVATISLRVKCAYGDRHMLMPIILFSFTGSKWVRILMAVHDGQHLVVRMSEPMDCTGSSKQATWLFVNRYLGAKVNPEMRTRFTQVKDTC